MNKQLIISITMLLGVFSAFAQDAIPVSDSTIIKALFKNGVDKDGNKIISFEEAKNTDTLILSKLRLTDASFLVHFKGLKYLDISNNKLNNLNVNANPFLFHLDVSYNKLKMLDLTMNSMIQNISYNNNYPSFYVIYVYHDESTYKNIIEFEDDSLLAAFIDIGLDQDLDNKISYEEAERVNRLNLSDRGIADLTGLKAFINLMELDVSKNKLTEVDFTGLRELNNLNLFKNDISSVVVKENKKLKYLTTSFNPLYQLDLSGNPKLIYLNCTANRLSRLAVWHNKEIKQIKSTGNQADLKIYYENPVSSKKKKKKKK